MVVLFLNICSTIKSIMKDAILSVLIIAITGALMGTAKADGEHPCGSVLNETTGVLQYKPFQTVDLNERCVWILRVPGASSYNITLYNLGYSGVFDRNALLMIGLNQSNHFTNKIIPNKVDASNIIEGNVAVLTFYSGRYHGHGRGEARGFSLFWTTRMQSDDDNQMSENSVTEIVSSLAKEISHPSDTSGLEQYDNNEISTFIFTPEFSNDVLNYKNEIRFIRKGLEGFTCNDYIDVFTFNPEYTEEGWKTFGRFCGPDKDVTFTAKDMAMLVFHSNSNGTNAGFELKYRRVENNQNVN